MTVDIRIAGEALVICDSDEHTEAGHITEDLTARIAQQDKRMRKLAGMMGESLPPERYGPPGAETLLLAWGSTYGACREAADLLNDCGSSAAMLHFAQPWPLDAAAIGCAIGSPRRILCVEGNQTGQLSTLLRSVGVLDRCELIRRYDGRYSRGDENRLAALAQAAIASVIPFV